MRRVPARHLPEPRRLRPGRKVRHDAYLKAYRASLRAAELAELDWLLYRRNCNPFRPGSQPHRVYARAFRASRRADPHPRIDKLPSLPAIRRVPRSTDTTPPPQSA